ncbi:MAG: hypothetical protein ACI4DY_13395 [Monoglobaceae bacterium]
MKSEAQKAAKKKYRQKCRVLQITLYPTDGDIVQHLASVGAYSTYIKELIRKDIQFNHTDT